MKKKIIVYVLNKKGKPLMPTTRLGKVRRLIRDGLAVPVCNNPFTIKLKYEVEDITQPLTLGIDTGRENIGESVTNEQSDCLFLCNTDTKNKTVKMKMTERSQHRSERRHHKRQRKQRKALRDNNQLKHGEDNILRSKKECKSINVSYPGMEESITCKVIKGAESQFNNRKRPDGWLTPSARQLIQVFFNCIKQTMSILPITQINIERVCFDFQKLENQNIHGWQYCKGPLYGFKDYKDYISDEQHGKCLICGEPITQYHHIIPKHDGGSDTVKNIAGLCDKCHHDAHTDLVTKERLFDFKQGLRKKYKISLLNSVMPTLIDELNIFCEERCIKMVITDGYTTYKTRQKLNVVKDHCTDGYCISLCDKDLDNINPTLEITNIYKRRRFKKKSNNNIKKLNTRLYQFNGETVAWNRHKATEQTKPSLEEYMNEYAKTHTKLECDQHFHELKIISAKRTYTFHKNGEVRQFKAGDKILCDGVVKKEKRYFVTTTECIKKDRIEYKNKDGKLTPTPIRICKLLNSNSVSYVIA